MKIITVTLVAVAVALAGAFAVAMHVKDSGQFHHKPAQVRIEEDQHGWDCEKMGNLRCGPVE